MKIIFQKISDWANLLAEMVGVILFVVLIFVIGAEVVARYVFNSSFSWSEEFGRMVFVWIIFLGASIGFKRGAHMGLHFIIGLASKKIKQMMSAATLFLSSVFFLFIIIEGIQVSIQMIPQLTSAMQISVAWEYSAIPVGALFMLIHVPALLYQMGEVGASNGVDSAV
ncbi:TRAP transporter small permease [Fodinisporobacter ferrooxydans]|uniref:TRAP transporter small permease n=1 Tax=Fodinisporobacter ferrooxydans TaxID=2901836 RepID=A0ABY4CDP4_9BACL|nr:TRAP transporter small permease [Alicyclobacillaceae bacterium MYW30-H2]